MNKSLADQFLSIMNNLDEGCTVARVEELYSDIKETEARANTIIQPLNEAEKILTAFILIIVWISGFLFAAGLLLAREDTALWMMPSLTALFAALGISLIISKGRRGV